VAWFGWLTALLIALLTGLCVVLVVPVAWELMSSVQRTTRIRGSFAGEKGDRIIDLVLADLCTHGVALLRVPTRFLQKYAPFARLTREVQAVMATRIAGCNPRAIAESMLMLSLFAGLVSFILTGQVFVALIGVGGTFTIIQFKAQSWLLARKSKLREQLPDALRGLGMCFMAGLSLEQAFDQTAQECREPLRRELGKTVDDMRTGSTVLESLDGLDARLAMDDMRFVSVALEIQHRTGGSMREVLDAAADSMLASFDLVRSLEVQTAQARLSARVVSLLPLALVLVLSLTMEGYLATFFSSPAGMVLLLAAVAMQVGGILIIRRILGIDLG